METKRHVLILLKLYCICIIEAAISNTETDLQIKNGGFCVKGQVYKKDCNSCHCVRGLHLICTKMACLRQSDLQTTNTNCVPGQFYMFRCRRCFCSHDERLLCGREKCNTIGKLPITNKVIHDHSDYPVSQQHRLPVLKHQASECKPGYSYRVDCNSCLCQANGSLMCGKRICHSHDNVNRVKAKTMSGKPCDNRPNQVECVLCRCIDGIKACKAIAHCSPAKKRVPLEDDPATKCTPGMIYRRACNKCICSENGSLRCTIKTCFDKTQANHLQTMQKVRKHWVDYTLRKSLYI